MLSHHTDDMVNEVQTCPRHCETLQLNHMSHLGRRDSYTNFHTRCVRRWLGQRAWCVTSPCTFLQDNVDVFKLPVCKSRSKDTTCPLHACLETMNIKLLSSTNSLMSRFLYFLGVLLPMPTNFLKKKQQQQKKTTTTTNLPNTNSWFH